MKFEKLHLLREKITINKNIYLPRDIVDKPIAHSLSPAAKIFDQINFPSFEYQKSEEETNDKVVPPSRKEEITIYTDGSAFPGGTRASFCAFLGSELIYSYKIGIDPRANNYLAEGFAILFAIALASSYGTEFVEEIPVKIYTDSMSTIQAIIKSRQIHQLNKAIKEKLIENRKVNLYWIKAHSTSVWTNLAENWRKKLSGNKV